MSKFPEFVALALLLAPAAVAADSLGLGREATPEEVAAWDIDVFPDGEGLPAGGMSAADGEMVFAEKCAVCHGDFAEGVDRWPPLAGGQGTLASQRPVKTVGSYWPYASTVWDYVHRAMPFGAAQTLTDDEVYGVTAYILYMSDVISDDELVLDAQTLSEVVMPNADGFFPDPRPDTPVYQNAERCMENCKEQVEITARASALAVTPDEEWNPSSSLEGGGSEPAPAPGEAAAEPAQELAAAEPAAEAAVDPALVAAGEKAFRKCSACHQLGEGAKNRVGPVLTGIVDAPAGAVDGFRYSDALVKAAEGGLTWTDENLHGFIENPRKFLEGTKMSFPGVKDEAERQALIAYLKAHGG